MRYAALAGAEKIQNVRAYLYRMARNILVDEQRRRAINRKAVGGLATDKQIFIDERTPERVLIAEERLNVLRAVIQASPKPRRRSFLLHRLEGLSCAEVARMTGYSESAVKKHITMMMADLEAAMSRVETKSPSCGHSSRPSGTVG